jgi:hypothetical protein
MTGRSGHQCDAKGLHYRGRHWWNKGFTREYMVQARRCFEQALAIDPANADAMIWMAAVDSSSRVKEPELRARRYALNSSASVCSSRL